jgi:DNA-binding transcriptional ArsR family regulator
MDSGDNVAAVAADAAIRVHRALASTVRADMLRLVAQQSQSVTDVARASRISISMTSRHLAMLADAGLIVRERNGSWVEHRITPAGAAALRSWSGEADEPSSRAPTAPQVRDAADLTALAVDDVDFVLFHGLGAFDAGFCDRDSWLERLTDDLGPEWRPRLPTVWKAAMRLCRGESLEGLPLPPGLLADPPPPHVVRPDRRAWVPAREDP